LSEDRRPPCGRCTFPTVPSHFNSVKGALLLPYVEKSKKEVGYDMTQDEFKLAEAAKDKNAQLIFACNGGECWKSYKASLWAQKQGYRNVHWFRGGFPECKAKNLPME
jgi:rhodanese-related sulfurtransferase